MNGDEEDLLRGFRVPGAPRDPDALVRGRHALLRHTAAGGRRTRARWRWTAWAPVAATVAILALVNAVIFVGIRSPADHVPGGSPGSSTAPGPVSAPPAAGGGTGPVESGAPPCRDEPPPRTGGHTIWVSVDGDDGRSGATAADALADPQTAVDRAGPGDQVWLSSGTYTSPRSTVLTISRDGAPGDPIVVTAAPGAHPIIRTGVENWNAMLVQGSNVVVSRLTLQGHRSETDLGTATAMVDANDSRTAGSGITVSPAPGSQRFPVGVVVAQNVVRDFPGAGIGAGQTGSVTIECNVVSGNAYLSPFGNSGISVGNFRSVGPGPDDVIVRRNVVHDNNSLVPRRASSADPAKRRAQAGNGISCGSSDDALWRGTLLVENNLIDGNGGSAVYLQNCDRVLVSGNTAAQDGARDGSTSAELTVTGSTDVTLVDNLVVFGPRRSGIATSGPVVRLVTNVVTQDAAVFVDAAAGDFRPRCDGPAADGASGSLSTDLFGGARPAGRASDVGAVESC